MNTLIRSLSEYEFVFYSKTTNIFVFFDVFLKNSVTGL